MKALDGESTTSPDVQVVVRLARILAVVVVPTIAEVVGLVGISVVVVK